MVNLISSWLVRLNCNDQYCFDLIEVNDGDAFYRPTVSVLNEYDWNYQEHIKNSFILNCACYFFSFLRSQVKYIVLIPFKELFGYYLGN